MYFTLLGKLNARRKNLTQDTDKGFTLIELLVVVIIIGILAAIAIPVYLGVQNNAKDSAVQSDITNLKTALVSQQTSGATITSATYSKLADFGTVLQPAGATFSSNTKTLTVTATTDKTGFCIAGVGTTNTAFAASDSTGVAKGTCSTAGAFVPAP